MWSSFEILKIFVFRASFYLLLLKGIVNAFNLGVCVDAYKRISKDFG